MSPVITIIFLRKLFVKGGNQNKDAVLKHGIYILLL